MRPKTTRTEPGLALVFAFNGGADHKFTVRQLLIEDKTAQGDDPILQPAVAGVFYRQGDLIGVRQGQAVLGGKIGKVFGQFGDRVALLLRRAGPIRADLAFPLEKRPGTGSIAFYVSIGQAF